MAIKITGDSVETLPTASVRQLPCTIDFSGKCNVAQRFDTYLEEGENGTTKGYFRGYPLVGKEIDIPEGYKGVVFSASATDESKILKAKSSFDQITYFNWSTTPSVTDPQQSIKDWITVAKAIHDD